jgi:hypothetical protein
VPFDQKTLVLTLEMLIFSLLFYELCSISMIIVPKFLFVHCEPGQTHFISGIAVDKAGRPYQRWLLIRRQQKQITYVLSNAAEETSLATIAWRKSHRYFIERSHQDAKSELGWAEFQAIKYRAWEHHLALTILASWFIADTRLDWIARHQRDPDLLARFETDVLPWLSVGNVRELFRTALPLPQFSPEEATALVIEHLINRTRSRNSRLQKQRLRERVPET